MSRFQRPHVNALISRLTESPDRIIALFGPRQTGKTTIVRQALLQVEQGRRYLAVDEPDSTALRIPSDLSDWDTVQLPQVRNTEWLVRNWVEARRQAERSERGFVLVFDEIQKIPGWSNTVKGLWDADRARGCPLHVVILGSAPLLIQSGLSESLAGRFESIHVTHWSFPEMSHAFGFTLQEYLYFGGYPGAANLVRDQARWRDYILQSLVEPNIERDILAMTRVDKAGTVETPIRARCRLLRADFVVHQDAGPTSRCRQHDHLGPLSRPAVERRVARWAVEVFRSAASSQGFESQAQYSEHRSHDRRFWIFLR